MSRFAPSDAKKASLDASIFLTRLLAKVPAKAGTETGRRGFALQNATTEHLRLLWPQDNRPFVTAALCSAMIDKCKADANVTQLIAGWLDDLALAGVGKAEADEWAARRGATVKSATSTVNGLAALATANTTVAAMGQGAPAAAPTSPVAPAAPSAAEVALRAELEAVKASAAAQADRMEAMMQQMMGLMAAAAAAKAPARKAKKVEVTVASTDSGESAEV